MEIPTTGKNMRGIFAAAAVAVLVILAGALFFFANGTARTTTAALGVGVSVTPEMVLIAPGLTESYAQLAFSPNGPVNGSLTLTVTGPEGISINLSKSEVSLPSPGAVTVTLVASPGIAPGNYSAMVTARQGLAEATASFGIEVVWHLVVMQEVRFSPGNITIRAGETVVWLNLDTTIGCCDPGYHNVDFLSGISALSPVLQRFQAWSHEFDATGAYEYRCKIHPAMLGEVIVTS